MKDDNEVWQDNEEVFLSLLNEYYTGLFSSSNPYDFERILDGVEEVVTEDMRRDLARPYTTEEVDVAIKEMAPFESSRARWYATSVLSDLLGGCGNGCSSSSLVKLKPNC